MRTVLRSVKDTGDPGEIRLSQVKPLRSLDAAWSLRLGMPHLGLSGLSEGWLLREAGHVHWTLLEEAVHARSSQWEDAQGNRLYASFVAVSISGELLHQAGEGDLLRCSSELFCAPGELLCSRHSLAIHERVLHGAVTMVSCLVRRTPGGGNAFVRGFLPRHMPPPEEPVPDVTRLMLARKEARSWPLRGESQERVEVSADDHYNAAGMIYFASFPRFADRAERRVLRLRNSEGVGPLSSRSLYYFGNAEAGEELDLAAGSANNIVRAHVRRGAQVIFASETRRTAARPISPRVGLPLLNSRWMPS